jgi:hypothetical protein
MQMFSGLAGESILPGSFHFFEYTGSIIVMKIERNAAC